LEHKAHSQNAAGFAASEALAWAAHLLQDVGYERAMEVAADLATIADAIDPRSGDMTAQSSRVLRAAILTTARRLRH
jgi:hypothetical protein